MIYCVWLYVAACAQVSRYLNQSLYVSTFSIELSPPSLSTLHLMNHEGKTSMITAPWINTASVMTCCDVLLVERERPACDKTVRHMVWCHHTEPSWSVCCTVVSVWLICNKTWHFKSPTCATSDNKPLLRSLGELVDSATPDDGVFISSPVLSGIILILRKNVFI